MNDSWLVYLSLEKEVIETFNYVHFCDSESQMKVYSRKYAELLLRISIEIETLSKELFFVNGGVQTKKTLYFDTDCLDYLDKVFKIKKKIVNISYPYYDCKNQNNKSFAPLSDFFLNDNNEWQKSYQGVKHDRLKAAKKANMKAVVHALAALYLLNIYFKNEKYVVHFNEVHNYDTRFGSDIFSLELPISRHNNLLFRANSETAVYEINMKPESKKELDALIEKYKERVGVFISSQPESKDELFMRSFYMKKHETLIELIHSFINLLTETRTNKNVEGLSPSDKISFLRKEYVAHGIDGSETINEENIEEKIRILNRTLASPLIQSFGPVDASFSIYKAFYDMEIIKYPIAD